MAEPLRVALVDHTARLGGAEWSLLRLVERLDPAEVRAAVVLGEEGTLGDRLRAAGVPVVVCALDASLRERRKDSLDGRGLADPRSIALAAGAVLRLRRVFRELEAEIVHTNSLKAHVLGGLAGRIAGARVLWHVRDHLAEPYLPRAAVRAVRLAARVVPDAVVAVSESAARTVPRRDVAVVHQGVDLPPLDGGRPDNGTLRVGLVGRIAPWKGQDVFLAAAAQVARAFPGAEFVLAGSPLFGEEDFEHELRATAERGDLRGRVQFLGFRDDVHAVFRELDVAVHASTQAEPYGNVVVEAMAAGKPVVASAAGGVLEIVEDGRTGVLVPPGDADALAAALNRLLGNPAERDRLGSAARRCVEERFSPGGDAAAITRLYRELVA
ncbi:MAG: glycosyltransferase family 4 protein [Actinobacteria bacterium]|nr:glycosyltransferase family 4 protein [Actinomycetota bacterium]